MKFILNLIAVLLPLAGASQARILFNGAKIRLAGNAMLVLDNPAPEALTVLSSGGLVSEAAGNSLVWHLGNAAADYRIPFVSGGGNIPVSFGTSGAVGNGRFVLSTYAGQNWQNRLYLPPTVTNMNLTGIDNSAQTIDRFWQISAVSYTVPPLLSHLQLTYNDNEWNETGNNITESDLTASNWNPGLSTWQSGSGVDDPAQNLVALPRTTSAGYFSWWTLSSGSVGLPLALLDFSVEKTAGYARLAWLVTAEINVGFYEVQRSVDAVHFMVVGQVPASAAQGSTSAYSYKDPLPADSRGALYYRLRMVDNDGKFSYSPVKLISFGDDAELQEFPNPVTNLAIVRFGNDITGPCDVSVFTSAGRLVFTRRITASPQAVFYFPRSGDMRPGAYLMTIVSGNRKKTFPLLYR